MFVAGVEIKISTMHVEATIDVISGLGFNSPRLHSTRCARSWQASEFFLWLRWRERLQIMEAASRMP